MQVEVFDCVANSNITIDIAHYLTDDMNRITSFGISLGEDASGVHRFLPFVLSTDDSPEHVIGLFDILGIGASTIGGGVKGAQSRNALRSGPVAMQSAGFKGAGLGLVGAVALRIAFDKVLSRLEKNRQSLFYVSPEGHKLSGPLVMRS